jgi:hypothetical protein
MKQGECQALRLLCLCNFGKWRYNNVRHTNTLCGQTNNFLMLKQVEL